MIMDITFHIILCFIPLLLVITVFKFIFSKLNISSVLVSVILGFLAVIPIAAIQFFISSNFFIIPSTLSGILIKNIFINGLIEESIKMAFLFFLSSKKRSFQVFFVCSLICGFAMGSFENIVYLTTGIAKTAMLRLFTAIIIHGCCTGLCGIFVYFMKNKNPIFFPFLMAIVLHGVYNYFAGFKSSTPFFYFSIAVVFYSIVECRIRYLAYKEKLEKR